MAIVGNVREAVKGASPIFLSGLPANEKCQFCESANPGANSLQHNGTEAAVLRLLV
jgi:hypothetical protein